MNSNFPLYNQTDNNNLITPKISNKETVNLTNQINPIPTIEINPIQNSLNTINLNKSAKDYIPKNKKSIQDEIIPSPEEVKLNLNLNAEEFIPKNNYDLLVKPSNEEEDLEECVEEEIDMIENDLLENEALEEYEEEESDDEKWFPKYKDCECCKGFIYKCKGSACTNMGVCYCKMKDECDYEDDN